MDTSLIMRASFKNRSSTPREHYHNAYQILYIKKASGRLNINKIYYPAVDGTLIFMSPLRNHFFEFNPGVCERYEVLINYNIAEKLINNQILMSVFQARPDLESCMVNVGEKSEEIERFFLDILQECNEEGAFSNEMQTANIYRLLTFVYRNFSNKVSFTQSQPEKNINHIRKYIEEKFSEPITVEEIAELFHLNRYYLTHSFKRVTGYSPKQYILLCRIAKARQMLSGTSVSIMEIAGMCGFGDASNFSRQFRAETGYTPKDFRAKHKNVI